MKYLLFILCALTLSEVQAQQPLIEQASELYEVMTRFRADNGSLNRFYYMPNSPERRARFMEFYDSYLSELDSYDFDQLSQGGKVDYLLFKRDLENGLKNLNQQNQEYASIKDWLSPGEAIYPIEQKRRRGYKLDAQATAEALNDIYEAISASRTSLNNSEPFLTPSLAKRAKQTILNQVEGLESIYEFYNGYDPQFSWWVTKPYNALHKEMSAYAQVFEQKIDPKSQIEDDGSGILGVPIGANAIQELLTYEMIPYTPQELIAIAEQEFKWCDTQLLQASAEMGYGDDWRAAQEAVKQTRVDVSEQPEAMLELYHQSIAFLKDYDLLTIPPLAEETWRMTMLSPERQRIAPFFLGGEVLQIAYPTDDMTHAEKMMSMRGNNPHFNRATVHHELIAGHHLQQFVNRRNKVYRSFRTPFWTEGWALYWELLLWDMDFPRGPEDRIGMLFWRMHRCARIIFSLNYHLGNWTPQECIDFLVDRVGFERANAEGEVRRSFTAGYGPLYQLAYMTGGLQFVALKRELVDSGQMSYKEFHDAVLSQNAMPVEMVRALLTDQDLTKSFKSNWRFYQIK
jgi:hypothetical protein